MSFSLWRCGLGPYAFLGGLPLACTAPSPPHVQTAHATLGTSRADAGVVPHGDEMPKGLPDPFVSLESRTPETLAWERREEDATVNALHSHARFDEVHAHMKSYRAAREPRIRSA